MNKKKKSKANNNHSGFSILDEGDEDENSIDNADKGKIKGKRKIQIRGKEEEECKKETNQYDTNSIAKKDMKEIIAQYLRKDKLLSD